MFQQQATTSKIIFHRYGHILVLMLKSLIKHFDSHETLTESPFKHYTPPIHARRSYSQRCWPDSRSGPVRTLAAS